MTRILFIDGFSTSSRSRAASKRARATLSGCMKQLKERGVSLIDYKIQVESIAKMRRFTFDDPRRHEMVLREIDKVDVVILDGDLRALPWSPILDPLTTFLRVCVLARKCIFAAGRMANVLSFVLATGARPKPFVVINGDGLGTPLDELQSFEPQEYAAAVGGQALAFLDSDTGDLYFVRGAQWVRQMNVGNSYGSNLPRRQSPGRSGKRGKKSFLVTRPSTAPVKPRRFEHAKIQKPYAGRNDEAVVLVRPDCCSHVLFGGIRTSSGFVVQRQNGVTVMDARDIRHCGYRYRTLAFEQSSSGNCNPMVFEYQNAVGAPFRLSQKYESSVAILSNYLTNKIDLILQNGHIDKRVHNNSIGSEAAASVLMAAFRRKIDRQNAELANNDDETKESVSEQDQHSSTVVSDTHSLNSSTTATTTTTQPATPVPARKSKREWSSASQQLEQTIKPYAVRIARNQKALHRNAERFEEGIKRTMRVTAAVAAARNRTWKRSHKKKQSKSSPEAWGAKIPSRAYGRTDADPSLANLLAKDEDGDKQGRTSKSRKPRIVSSSSAKTR